MFGSRLIQLLLAGLVGCACAPARADVVTEWNAKSAEITALPGLPPPGTYFAYRAMAIVQVAVFNGVNAVTSRYPSIAVKLEASPDASIDAVVAAAARTSLLRLAPSQATAIDAAYQAQLAKIPDTPSKERGIALGEHSAELVLDLRENDGATAPDRYQPQTSPGVYVPTMLPVAPHWGRRKPWILTSGDQFRPAPPPDLHSDVWVRDFNEVKSLGARNSTTRTAEQTGNAKFWEAAIPTIYFNMIRSYADLPGREVTANARLLALTAMAMDDALIAVIDAKYTYNFWRPITAIRNGGLGENDKTERGEGWLPLIDTPMHPEYPCAHCILSSAVAMILKEDAGSAPLELSGTSPSAPGVVHKWKSIDEFTAEVSLARIYAGVHFRNSTEVGAAMGKKVGLYVIDREMRATRQ